MRAPTFLHPGGFSKPWTAEYLFMVIYYMQLVVREAGRGPG